MASTSVTTPPYTITRKRIRTLRLTVKAPGGDVHVSAPSYVSERAIAEFVASKQDWIAKQQARLEQQPARVAVGSKEAELLRKQVRADATDLIAYWAPQLGVPVPTLTVRHMNTRWGSCNISRVHINLSLELGRRDPELLEYVVVHELAHLIEPSHNQRFYAVMDKHLPDWKSKRRVLNGRA